MASSGYVVYQEAQSPKLGAGLERLYWHGPGTRQWSAGEDARRSVPRFADQYAARAAATGDDEGGFFGGQPDRLGYEWVSAREDVTEEAEQPALFPLTGASS